MKKITRLFGTLRKSKLAREEVATYPDKPNEEENVYQASVRDYALKKYGMPAYGEYHDSVMTECGLYTFPATSGLKQQAKRHFCRDTNISLSGLNYIMKPKNEIDANAVIDCTLRGSIIHVPIMSVYYITQEEIDAKFLEVFSILHHMDGTESDFRHLINTRCALDVFLNSVRKNIVERTLQWEDGRLVPSQNCSEINDPRLIKRLGLPPFIMRNQTTSIRLEAITDDVINSLRIKNLATTWDVKMGENVSNADVRRFIEKAKNRNVLVTLSGGERVAVDERDFRIHPTVEVVTTERFDDDVSPQSSLCDESESFDENDFIVDPELKNRLDYDDIYGDDDLMSVDISTLSAAFQAYRAENRIKSTNVSEHEVSVQEIACNKEETINVDGEEQDEKIKETEAEYDLRRMRDFGVNPSGPESTDLVKAEVHCIVTSKSKKYNPVIDTSGDPDKEAVLKAHNGVARLNVLNTYAPTFHPRVDIVDKALSMTPLRDTILESKHQDFMNIYSEPGSKFFRRAVSVTHSGIKATVVMYHSFVTPHVYRGVKKKCYCVKAANDKAVILPDSDKVEDMLKSLILRKGKKKIHTFVTDNFESLRKVFFCWKDEYRYRVVANTGDYYKIMGAPYIMQMDDSYQSGLVRCLQKYGPHQYSFCWGCAVKPYISEDDPDATVIK